jgi:hypothetical protein
MLMLFSLRAPLDGGFKHSHRSVSREEVGEGIQAPPQDSLSPDEIYLSAHHYWAAWSAGGGEILHS